MYHIFASQCQTQFGAREARDDERALHGFSRVIGTAGPQRPDVLAPPVRRPISGLDEGGNLAPPRRRLDLDRTENEEPGLLGLAEEVEKAPRQKRPDEVAEARRRLGRLPRTRGRKAPSWPPCPRVRGRRSPTPRGREAWPEGPARPRHWGQGRSGSSLPWATGRA